MHIYQKTTKVHLIIPGLESLYKERALKEQGREWLVASYTPEEFRVTNPDDVKWMNPRLIPMPWHTHDQQLRITNPKARILSKSYVCCTEFGNAQFKLHFTNRSTSICCNWEERPERSAAEEAMIIPYIAVFLGPSIAARIPPGT
jgi:hypothetical protein